MLEPVQNYDTLYSISCDQSHTNRIKPQSQTHPAFFSTIARSTAQPDATSLLMYRPTSPSMLHHLPTSVAISRVFPHIHLSTQSSRQSCELDRLVMNMNARLTRYQTRSWVWLPLSSNGNAHVVGN